jgi:polysaccharide biosynthesis/export protein
VLNGQCQTMKKTMFTRAGLIGASALVALAGLTGCEVDSYLDPSVTGRWERTPTRVPILDRLAAIEDASDVEGEYSEPTSADLIPVAKLYRLGAGDRLEIEIYDVIEPGRPEKYERSVDTRGMVELPQFGQIAVGGLTIDEARGAIARVVARLVPDPLVSLNPLSQRQQTFTLLGAVQQPGPFYIPSADYRLLEALTAGGPIDDSVPWVYVIRQIQLTEAERGSRPPGTHIPEPPVERPSDQPKKESGEHLIDVIDDITKPVEPKTEPRKEEPPIPEPKVDIPGSPGMLGWQPAETRPAVDIDAPEQRPLAPQSEPITPGGQWVELNGKWVQVAQGTAETLMDAGPAPIMTQRIIRVSMKDVMEGKREANIVIRPGDVVRVPPAPKGVFYVSGQVGRPGTFGFPQEGRMTLIRAIVVAGGLGGLAIPERVDLMRMVGPNTQATIRLNLRAISEQTQPDIYIKGDDVINIGTNFWALPLAVLRNGFRASYGFGFLLDRNFDEEVFGLKKSQELRIPQ